MSSLNPSATTDDVRPATSAALVHPDDAAIKLVAEDVVVGKRIIETGRVRVRTVVDVEPVIVKTTLAGTYVTVDRVAVGRVVDAVPQVRDEDGVTIVPVVEERLRVVRELVLVEEVHLRTVHTNDPVDQTIDRRVMRAVVERLDPQQEPTG